MKWAGRGEVLNMDQGWYNGERKTCGNLACERELVAAWSPQAKLCSLDTELSAGAWLGMSLRYMKSSWVMLPFLVLLFQVLLLVNLSPPPFFF